MADEPGLTPGTGTSGTPSVTSSTVIGLMTRLRSFAIRATWLKKTLKSVSVSVGAYQRLRSASICVRSLPAKSRIGWKALGSLASLPPMAATKSSRSEEHTSELQSPCNLVCRLLLEKKKNDAEAAAAPGRLARVPRPRRDAHRSQPS